jgi:DNA polymerase III subunit epsilon
LYETKNACFKYKIKECDGACIGEISPEEYNDRVEEFIDNNEFESQNRIIIDRGRSLEERSAVLIENGIYKGYCFFDLNYQITNVEVLKTLLSQCKITEIPKISSMAICESTK